MQKIVDTHPMKQCERQGCYDRGYCGHARNDERYFWNAYRCAVYKARDSSGRFLDNIDCWVPMLVKCGDLLCETQIKKLVATAPEQQQCHCQRFDKVGRNEFL